MAAPLSQPRHSYGRSRLRAASAIMVRALRTAGYVAPLSKNPRVEMRVKLASRPSYDGTRSVEAVCHAPAVHQQVLEAFVGGRGYRRR